MNRETLLSILDRGRWAPSGDNTQPWRFEVLADDYVVVHGHDTRDHVLYDFDGHASHIAHGALLETIRIAASAKGLTTTWTVDADPGWRRIEYHVRFLPSSSVVPDPLYDFIERRTVQRRSMRMTPITATQRRALLSAAGNLYELGLFETLPERIKIAGLLWRSAGLRYTCPEAFPVHQSIIEWGAQFSKDRIPEQAVGVDPMTARLMHWAMKSWKRVDFLNRYLLGTIAPRLQLDYVPAVRCAAHLLIKFSSAPQQLEDWVGLGQAVQRVWLTATQMGLHLQPEMTPVIFRWYARANRSFSSQPAFSQSALALAEKFEQVVGGSQRDAFGFLARVGVSPVPWSRSLRRDLRHLTAVDKPYSSDLT